MSAVAIIPARGGSRRIQGKNIRMFHGRPIIAYSIETALGSGLFDDIYVSTEDENIESTVRMNCRHDSVGIVRRPDLLAIDSVGTQDVAAHALRALSTFSIGYRYEYACCIYATAPLMTVADLCYGYAKLRETNAPYVYTVGPDCQDAGQWYWGTTKAFIDSVPLNHGFPYALPPNRVCDINTEEDWMRAERMYEVLHGPK